MATKLKPRLDPVEHCSAGVLDLVMRLSQLTDGEVGQRIGMAGQQVQARRTGWTRIRPGELLQLAAALDIPQGVFGMEPADVLVFFAERKNVESYMSPDWVSTKPVIPLYLGPESSTWSSGYAVAA